MTVAKDPSRFAQLPLALSHGTSLEGEDFFISPCNAEAVGWLEQWPNWPGRGLCLVGPKASGKSHLVSVHAAKVRALTLEGRDLMPDLDPIALLGNAQAVVLDNAEAVLDPGSETAFFHTINAAQAIGATVLLSAETPPKHWALTVPDLVSRLATFSVAKIYEPDDAVLMAVMIKLFQDRQLRVGSDVLSYLVDRMERSFEAANTLVSRLDEASLAGSRAITKPLARSVLMMNN